MSLLSKLFGKAPARRATVESTGQSFEIAPGATILEQALQEGMAYPHDCTVGTCGSCRTRLVSGRVDEITPFGYTLSREELEAGYILACQALPKSDLVIAVELASGDAIQPERQAARLAATSDLTHDIKQLVLTVDKPIQYRAGQYANIYWGEGAVHRSYSFAAAPDAAGTSDPAFFVRHVPGGRFTDRLFGTGFADLPFEIDGPHGNFWLRGGKGPIVCIAGGSGLAPILSLLEDAARRRVRRDCVLLYGGRGARDVYGLDAIAAVRNAWTASFDFWPILSEEKSDAYRHGFVTEYVARALDRLGPDAQGYLCGPPAMIDAGIAVLTQNGVDLADIFYDKFTDASTGA